MPTPLDKTQLRKLLLVALSSDQPGEVMNALTMVKAALARAGLDVHWLADAVVAARGLPNTPNVHWDPVSSDWREQLQYCTTHGEDIRQHLGFSEDVFITDITKRWANNSHWEPSVKQRRWLNSIYTKLQIRR